MEMSVEFNLLGLLQGQNHRVRVRTALALVAHQEEEPQGLYLKHNLNDLRKKRLSEQREAVCQKSAGKEKLNLIQIQRSSLVVIKRTQRVRLIKHHFREGKHRLKRRKNTRAQTLMTLSYLQSYKRSCLNLRLTLTQLGTRPLIR